MVHLCPRLTVIIAVKNVCILTKLAESLFFLIASIRKNIHGTLFSEYGLVSKAECFLEGQRDHFLAIIRKNILRAVFPGRGLMARWHNGGGGVLSSSRSGGRGARGRRQPTIMDSPSFHSLSFLVDVFVFVFVFPINFKVCSRITRLFVSIPFQNCPIHKKIVVDCVLVNNAF